MTEHLINSFASRLPPPSPPPRQTGSSFASSGGLQGTEGQSVQGCSFCEIVEGIEPAYKVFEDEHVLAIVGELVRGRRMRYKRLTPSFPRRDFPDILPIRPGHLLLLPKQHHERVTDLPDDLSAHLGRVLPRVTRALSRATGQPDFSVVSNNGYLQAVPHVHLHLVPAPRPSSAAFSSSPASSTRPKPPRRLSPFSTRVELDDGEAQELVRRVSEELAKENRRGLAAKL